MTVNKYLCGHATVSAFIFKKTVARASILWYTLSSLEI